ncbi:MAG: dUTP diphosphatase [Candidatus Magasanikbacteria bacterium]
MQIKITRIDKTLPLPAYHTAGSVAFDFAASADTTIASRALGYIPTGLIIQAPPGYMLAIIARSSLAKKHGLMLGNGVGVIDQDYCGPQDEIKLMVYNITDAPVTITRGERVAQGIFLPVQIAEWQEVDEIASASRGGFGSTG